MTDVAIVTNSKLSQKNAFKSHFFSINFNLNDYVQSTELPFPRISPLNTACMLSDEEKRT